MPSSGTTGADRRRFQAVDALERVESAEWSVSYVSLATGSSDLNKRKFLHAVRRWLTGLNRDLALADYETNRLLPEYRWVGDGWEILLQALPLRVGVPAAGVRGLYTSEVERVNTPTRLRSAIEQKARRYGRDIRKPLLLVVVSGLRFSTPAHLMPALLGDWEWVIDTGGSIEHRRKPNGAWIGANGLRGGRVSAVLYADRFGAWSMADAQWQLVHHPQPDHRLRANLIATATEVTWSRAGRGQERPPKQSFRDFFGLSVDWPGPD